MNRPSEASPSGASVFAFLGNDVRLAILDSLYERTVEAGPMTDEASYSTIREDVGVDDSGRFNYHLDKLVGRFVTRHGDGYRLLESGRTVVRIRRTGILSSKPDVEPRSVDAACYRCGSGVVVGYDHGHLLTRCPDCPGLLAHDLVPEGTLSALSYPPSGIESTDLETAFHRAHRRGNHQVCMMSEGFCPCCAGDVTVAIDPCLDHDHAGEGVCNECRLSHPGFVGLSCDVCGLLRMTHPLYATACREPVAGILAARDVEPGWERFAELMRWPVTVAEGEIAFDAPDGSRILVTDGLEVVRDGPPA